MLTNCLNFLCRDLSFELRVPHPPVQTSHLIREDHTGGFYYYGYFKRIAFDFSGHGAAKRHPRFGIITCRAEKHRRPMHSPFPPRLRDQIPTRQCRRSPEPT
ncbi:hypothetical protein SXCC_00722 [Gluconacetobacter sp. SXCC-1]|nr:hypothetical protein SXCC_00722 [Gluconacetobacter sp. SXCC-1]